MAGAPAGGDLGLLEGVGGEVWAEVTLEEGVVVSEEGREAHTATPFMLWFVEPGVRGERGGFEDDECRLRLGPGRDFGTLLECVSSASTNHRSDTLSSTSSSSSNSSSSSSSSRSSSSSSSS